MDKQDINKKEYVFFALPYSNGFLHIGHFIGSILPAGVYFNYLKYSKVDVSLISGSDQFGTPVLLESLKRKKLPGELSDSFHEKNKKILSFFLKDNLSFFKTNSAEHIAYVNKFYETMGNKIFFKKEKVYFCKICDQFRSGRYIVGTCIFCNEKTDRGFECVSCGKYISEKKIILPKCKLCSHSLDEKFVSNLFMKLGKVLKKKLHLFVDTCLNFPEGIKKMLKNILIGLPSEVSISRILSWGVPVRFSSEKRVFFVWFEALVGYFSFIKQKTGEDSINKDQTFHFFFGKDNLYFHSVILPSILQNKGVNLKRIKLFYANYCVMKDKKISKEDGNIFNLERLASIFPADSLFGAGLFYFPAFADSEISMSKLFSFHNDIFISKICNLFHRFFSLFSKEKKIFFFYDKQAAIEKKILFLLKNKKLKESYQKYVLWSEDLNKEISIKKIWLKGKEKFLKKIFSFLKITGIFHSNLYDEYVHSFKQVGINEVRYKYLEKKIIYKPILPL